MKIYVEVGDKFLLLMNGKEYSNENNDVLKTEIINDAMNILENNKLEKEIEKQKLGGYLVKKLGVHPDMQKSA